MQVEGLGSSVAGHGLFLSGLLCSAALMSSRHSSLNTQALAAPEGNKEAMVSQRSNIDFCHLLVRNKSLSHSLECQL